eukprot:m.135838 g.135838  ORF g.135838 m.135838 type:complete len:168 (-) comp52462_c0_seq9:1342-1845(-)
MCTDQGHNFADWWSLTTMSSSYYKSVVESTTINMILRDIDAHATIQPRARAVLQSVCDEVFRTVIKNLLEDFANNELLATGVQRRHVEHAFAQVPLPTQPERVGQVMGPLTGSESAELPASFCLDEDEREAQTNSLPTCFLKRSTKPDGPQRDVPSEEQASDLTTNK